MFFKTLTVYNKWQKEMFYECYNDWVDSSSKPSVIGYDSKSITYSVSFRYKANLNGFLNIFFANIKIGKPKYY